MRRDVSHVVGTSNRNCVDASARAAQAFSSQSNVVFVNKLPVGRRVAGAGAADGLIAADVGDSARDAAAIICCGVINRYIAHRVVRRRQC